MTMSLHTGGATKDVTGIAVRVGGALKTVTEGWVRTGGVLKQFYGQLAISLNRTSVIGRGNSAGTTTIVSATVTATPTGAIGAVSYSWVRTAADGHSWTITNPTGATTAFQTAAAANEDWSATFTCTITDSAGQTITSGTVTADCANNYFGGGGGPYP